MNYIPHFVEGDAGGAARPAILQEIVEACFIKGAMRGWGNAALPLVQRVLGRATPELKDILGPRALAFSRNYVGEKRPPAESVSAEAASPVSAG